MDRGIVKKVRQKQKGFGCTFFVYGSKCIFVSVIVTAWKTLNGMFSGNVSIDKIENSPVWPFSVVCRDWSSDSDGVWYFMVRMAFSIRSLYESFFPVCSRKSAPDGTGGRSCSHDYDDCQPVGCH